MIHCTLCGYKFDERNAKCAPACPLATQCHFICCPNCGYTMNDPKQATSVRLINRLWRMNDYYDEKKSN